MAEAEVGSPAALAAEDCARMTGVGLSGDPLPAVQRYLIAWSERERASREMSRSWSTMIANEYDTRHAIWAAQDRFIEAVLLDGQRFKVSIAPNGRDIMVLPLGEAPDA